MSYFYCKLYLLSFLQLYSLRGFKRNYYACAFFSRRTPAKVGSNLKALSCDIIEKKFQKALKIAFSLNHFVLFVLFCFLSMITRKGHNLFKANDYFAKVYSQNYDILWTCITFRTTAKISEPLKMFWYNWWYTNFIFSCWKYLSSSIAFLRKRSCDEVTKRKIIKRPVVRYFSIFLFEIQKIFIQKCSTFIYNSQALPGSLKFQTWCFSLTLGSLTHPNAWHWKTFQWHASETNSFKHVVKIVYRHLTCNMERSNFYMEWSAWLQLWNELTFGWSEVTKYEMTMGWNDRKPWCEINTLHDLICASNIPLSVR